MRGLQWSVCGIAAAWLISCGSSTPSTRQAPAPETLRAAAAQRAFYIGAAPQGVGSSTPALAQLMTREFNLITVPAYIFLVHKEQGTFDFSGVDYYADLAVQHGMKLRIHTLVWGKDDLLPTWVHDLKDDPGALRAAIRNHITRVIRHFEEKYPGQVIAYDVVNEALQVHGTGLRKTLLQAISDDPLGYVEFAFKVAHEVAPNAPLYINEIFSESWAPKALAYIDLIRTLRDRGVPVSGIGIQAHSFVTMNEEADKIIADAGHLGMHAAAPTTLQKRIADLAQFGLPIHVTELDVPVLLKIEESPVGALEIRAKLERQVELYEAYVAACLQHPLCKAVVIWGVTDKASWIDQFFPAFGKPLLFDEQARKKPAYHGVMRGLTTSQSP